jgi:transcriptional regulator with XRE-family HTH domain
MARKGVLRLLGEELRSRRKATGLSQESLAHAAGVHVNVVGRLERGQYNPTVLVLQAIASKLNVSLSELFASTE